MQAAPEPDVTGLLHAWRGGDQQALEQLMPILYQELRRTARHYMRRERDGHTLQTTALVNEAYLRLVDVHNVEWQDRVHFFAIAAQMMRRVLVDHARNRGSLKRGGAVRKISLDDNVIAPSGDERQLIALDDALNALAKVDARKAKVVELRFFAGLNVEETASVLSVSTQTVLRDWSLAKAWLMREMSHGEVHRSEAPHGDA